MSDSSDEAVWDRVRSGDARGFGLIWDRHADRVLTHLLASGHQRADAEELAATAFLELWWRRSAVRFVDGSVLPWLIVTARNVARNAVRAHRRYGRLLSQLSVPDPVPDPADDVADRDATARLLRETINPSTSWTASDITSSANLTTSYDFPLDATVSTLYLTPSALDWVVTIQYVTQVPTDFGVNAHGQSYGVTGDPRGEPDLIAVGATNGRQGYVYRTELDAANGTTAAEGFKTPEDAVKWQEPHSGDVRRLPVYESHGETQIGEFPVGG